MNSILRKEYGGNRNVDIDGIVTSTGIYSSFFNQLKYQVNYTTKLKVTGSAIDFLFSGNEWFFG